MVKKGVLTTSLIIVALLAVFLIGFALAEDNQSQNNTGNDNNQTPNNQTNITCTKDRDCNEGYECKNQICKLEDEEDKNESGDDNEREDENETECEWQCSKWSECLNNTSTRTCNDINNCTTETPKLSKSCKERDKVCCKSTENETEDNETKTKIEYEYEDRASCLETDEDGKGEVKEIVEKALCMDKIKEECEQDELRDRIKCRFDNNRFENFSESDETCEGLRNTGLCVALYVRSQNCFKSEEGEKRDRCFKMVAEFKEDQINKEINKSENKTQSREKLRLYMVLVLENLQKRIEKAVNNSKITSAQGAVLIEKLVEIKQAVLDGEDKPVLKSQIQELKNMWKTYKLENE